MLKSAHFRNFKALRDFSVSLREMNVFVGPNNSGKSTVLDGFRALASALRFAKRFKAAPVPAAGEHPRMGYLVPDTQLPISTLNIHSDYRETDSSVVFTLETGDKLNLLFKPDRRCIFFVDEARGSTTTPATCRNKFPVEIAIVPTLGPFEDEETYLSDEYFNRWAFTRRGHRMFRNLWYRRSENFDEFKDLVERTWPGMSIELPEMIDYRERRLAMFCREGRIPREVYWSGYGFQIWLQLLTHILSAGSASAIVIDEPDIYLHPELQHRLFNFLKTTDKQVLMATHSVEIINEAEQDEVVIVDKGRRSAKRANDISVLQEAIFMIGSTQNIQLERLSRGRKVLFLEGTDFKIEAYPSASGATRCGDRGHWAR
jgi:energy-coupling factor transporter ATP-binding protein EcfA2